MEHPEHAVAAVTHPDPYPYYGELVARRPLFRDPGLGLWVASGAEAVTAVLTSDLCRVRPPAEPVPRALLGTPAERVFGHLVRMNDGPRHCPFKRAVVATLESLDVPEVEEEAARWAQVLSDETRPQEDPRRLPDFAFRLPVFVMASLLGVSQDMLSRAAAWVADFVRCLAPASSPEEISRGGQAAGQLLDAFRAILEDSPAGREPRGLLPRLAAEARGLGLEDPLPILANGIGFLSQAYEATAGLIGNTLLALARYGDVRGQVRDDPATLHDVLEEVLRHDPPVQNTRRFLAGAGMIAGQEIREGETILVVLAAANRDPRANAHPDRFEPARPERRNFTFGLGPHACPGHTLATAIAGPGLRRLVASGLHLPGLAGPTAYRPSANTRIPLFTAGGTA